MLCRPPLAVMSFIGKPLFMLGPLSAYMKAPVAHKCVGTASRVASVGQHTRSRSAFEQAVVSDLRLGW